MEESPNLSYVYEISGQDSDFAKRFINVLKEEFRLEVGMYLRYIKLKQPRKAAEIVAISKYKIKILGLEKAFTFAEQHEYLLQEGDAKANPKFVSILENVNSFLAKI